MRGKRLPITNISVPELLDQLLLVFSESGGKNAYFSIFQGKKSNENMVRWLAMMKNSFNCIEVNSPLKLLIFRGSLGLIIVDGDEDGGHKCKFCLIFVKNVS